MRWPSRLIDNEHSGREGIALAQILGVMPDRLRDADGDLSKLQGFEDSAKDASMNDRYGGLKIQVLTNQPAVLGLASSLKASCSLTTCAAALTTAAPPAGAGMAESCEKPERVQEAGLDLSKEVTGLLADGTTDLLIVHLDCGAVTGGAGAASGKRARSAGVSAGRGGGEVGAGEEESGEVGAEARSSICLQLLDKVAYELWKDGESDMLQVVVAGAPWPGRDAADAEGATAAESGVVGGGDGLIPGHVPSFPGHVLGDAGQGGQGNGVQGGDGAVGWLEYVRPPQSSHMHNGRLLSDKVWSARTRVRVRVSECVRENMYVCVCACVRACVRGERARAREKERQTDRQTGRHKERQGVERDGAVVGWIRERVSWREREGVGGGKFVVVWCRARGLCKPQKQRQI